MTACQILRDAPARESLDSVGAAEKSELEAVIARSDAAVQGCYAEARELWPSLDGQVVIRFVVQANGTVADAAFATYKSTITEPSVGCCIAHLAHSWKFRERRDGKQVALEYPFTLTMDLFKVPFPVTVDGRPQPASGTEIHQVW